MKRILFFYLFDHSGHHRACVALQKAFLLHAPNTQTQVVPLLERIHPPLSKWLESLYFLIIYHTPKLWGVLYDRKVPWRIVEALLPRWVALKRDSIRRIIEPFHPDAVVCTQAAVCWIAAEYKRTAGNPFLLFGVLTDFHPNVYWIHSAVDRYIVPGEHALRVLLSRGIRRDKILEMGIPVDPDFKRPDPGERSLLRQRLGLWADRPHVLVMGGGRGLMEGRELAGALDTLHLDFQVTFLAGLNEKLQRDLELLIPAFQKSFRILGYVDSVADWMRSADVLVTKGGGLTLAEAMAIGLPTVIVRHLAGQEDHNARILSRRKNFFLTKNAFEAAQAVQRILRSREALEPHGPSSGERIPTSLEVAGAIERVL